MNIWVRHLSSLLAIIVVGFYCLNIDTILAARRWNPYYYQGLLFFGLVIAFPVFSAVSRRVISQDMPNQPLMKWLLLLLVLSMISTLASQDSASLVKAWGYLASTLVIVLTTVYAMLFVRRNGEQYERPYFYIFLFIISSIAVIVDPIVDFRSVFNIDLTGVYEITRGGGLYFQPNAGGTAIAFLYGVVVPRVSKRAAAVLTLLAISAVFLTFSRSSMIVLLILVFFALVCGYLPKLTAVGWFILLLSTVLYLGGAEFIAGTLSIESGSGYKRLFESQDFIGMEALSEDSRISAAQGALESYLAEPVLGHGMGYSWYWADAVNAGVGPHNMLLRFMLEYGSIGVLVWVLFLVSLYRSRPLEGISARWAFGVCLAGFIAALFSHNLTEQGYILVPLIAAVMLVAPKRRVR